MRRILALALALSLAFTPITGLGAQSSTGIIRGVVKDASGAVLPGVTVEITSPSMLEKSRSTTTDVKGAFTFVGVAPGAYRLIARLAGFQTVNRSFGVAADRIVTVDVEFRVGSVAETITVSGETPGTSGQRSSSAKARSRRGADAAGVAGGVVGGVVGGVAGGASVIEPGARGPRFNTEAYDKIDDNQWTEASRRPLSTFSIDVDTASYSNVRRFLNQGQLPPKDAVRIEELINYFGFDYAEPAGDEPFSVTTAVNDCPWNPRHRLALVGLQARRISDGQTPPRNLVFLVDVSGSMMAPNKLPLVKASLAMLARNLTLRDRVAIVVYAGAAGLVLPSTSGADTTTIVEALGRLEAGGSTNGAEGLRLAYRVAKEHFVAGGANRVVIATDGDFNVGVTGQGDLVRLIEEQRESGVTLSVLGFGMGNLKDSTMEKLADKGNGNYAYIDSLQEAQKVLVEQAGGTFVTVAKDVKLQIEFNPLAVGAYRLIGYENRILQDQDFNNDRKDAGDMGAGHSVTALYELAPVGETGVPGIDPLKYQRPSQPSPAASRDELMTIKLRYKQPEGTTSSLMTRTVSNRSAATENLGFAAAVVEFGMLLRQSEFKGSASYAEARDLARRFKGTDPYGHRAEFIRLVDVAESLQRLHPLGN